MSEKKPNSLRNALREMRVNEPMRLSKSGPSFKPPLEVSATSEKEVPPREVPPSEIPRTEAPQKVEARNEAPQKVEARNEAPLNGVTQTKVAQNEAPETELPHGEATQNKPPQNEGSPNELPHSEPPRNENAHNGHPQVEQPQSEVTQVQHTQNEGPRSETPRNEPARSEAPRKKQAKSEPPRNEAASGIEVAQTELPQIEQSSRAFFRLSDRSFSYPQLRRLSGDCFRLFLWMSSRGWRFQTSDGTLRASVGFIEAHTGMSHATISRCLKTLKEEALVELLEIDYKRGNLWSISPIAFAGCEPENLPPRSEGPRKKAPPASKRDRSHLNLREKAPQNEGQIRSIKKSKNLSQEGAQAMFDRIEKIRAPEKQKTERDGLLQLLETHTCEEISTTLAYVDRYGTLSGESCHSPFRYLATAIDDLLQTCRKKGFTQAEKADGKGSQNEAKLLRDERQEDERNRAAIAAFQSELTEEERTKFVSDFVAMEFTFGYKPSDALATRLAAMQWFTGRQSVQAAQAR